MQISNTSYNKFFNGYAISDCAVRSRDIFCFILRNNIDAENAGPTTEANVKKRALTYLPYDPPNQQFGSTTLSSYRQVAICGSQHNEDKAVVVSVDGYVYTMGGANAGKEEIIPLGDNGPRRGAIFRTRMIGGVLYAVGSGHTVCYRNGRNNWESLCHNLPQETRADFDDVEKSDNMSFTDIDGFSAHDLYVIAGKGRVWHFNGEKWNAVSFPSNMYVHSVCCAGDGYVYIGAQSGSIFRGRKNEWKLIVRGELTLPFKDIVWHAKKLWLTNDYGIWNVDGTKLAPADLPSDEIAVCTGNLSVADGVMLMAGIHGAAMHDGNSWQLIFTTFQFED